MRAPTVLALLYRQIYEKRTENDLCPFLQGAMLVKKHFDFLIYSRKEEYSADVVERIA